MPQSKQLGWLEGVRRRRAFVTMDVAIAITAAVFMVDLMTDLQGAIAVLYIAVPLILASVYPERVVIAAAVTCATLATVGFLSQHVGVVDDSADVRFGVSIAALAVTTFLALRQKRSAAELERSEQRFRALFDDAGFAAWESDWSLLHQYLMTATSEVSGDLETWLLRHPEITREASSRTIVRNINQAAVLLTGLSKADDLIGSNITRVKRDTLEGAETGLARIYAGLMDGKGIVEAEMSFLTLKGRRREILLRVALVGYGRPWSSVLAVALDETERKEARAKLEQASADLAHAERISTLGQLTASITHEVSQPLAAMVAYAGSGKRWLTRDEPDMREAEKSLDRIVENGRRASDVIARIHSLTRKAPAIMEPVELPKLIDETVALIAHDARVAGVVILREQQRGIPLAWADRVQVQQVLVNLLLNGIQAVGQVDDRERQVTITLESGENDMVQIEVCDTGTGVADPSEVFAPFFTTKRGGMGMGLSISRCIVESHGGSIHVRNNRDFGATFSFSLRSAAEPELEEVQAEA
jgi:C4-dicarboxylate-specific signal transduction histidine kinase